MAKLGEEIRKDWDSLKEKVKEDVWEANHSTDQMLDYSNSFNPDEINLESLYAQPAAEKAVSEAMEEYRESLDRSGSK